VPRQTEITLTQVGFAVRKTRQQEVDSQGNAVFGASGLPKMLDIWVLDFIHQAPGEMTVYHVPFDEAAKDRLLAAFTEGIVIANQLPTNGGI
jgi:hypothetical protein